MPDCLGGRMELELKGIIGKSPVLQRVFRVLEKVAPTESTVLVSGESGTGKELIVRALHANSRRREKPFIPINCGAIPKDLLESELFGHEKGAFTHAIRSRQGRFELANGGTVFLDEIGEMDPSLQVKILRVLQEREFERVGGVRSLKVDVRIVAATNRDLEEEVRRGRFREDLFYRLNVIPIHLPPLRERGRDILLLAGSFLHRACVLRERSLVGLSPDAKDMLLRYSWPGNVRELENFMERLTILSEGDTITPEDLPAKIWEDLGRQPEQAAPQAAGAGFVWPQVHDLRERDLTLKALLDEVEERLLLEALDMADGVKNQAAEILGIKRTTLIEKIKKKGLAGH